MNNLQSATIARFAEITKTIGHNNFVNDMKWRERAQENAELALEARDLIAQEKIGSTKEGRMETVKMLDFLEEKNL